MLGNIKKTLLKSELLKSFVYRIITIPNKVNGYNNLKKYVKNENENDKIKVVFFVQLPALWNKVESVYQCLVADKQFDIEILAIPDYRYDDNKEFDLTYNKAYEFLSDKGIKSINAYTENGWYNLQKSQPDYVFYPRPYDPYMPIQYKSSTVSKYAKICYISYGYLLTTTLQRGCMDINFFSNLYLFFAESDYIKDYNKSRFKITHFRTMRKSINVGYPPLEDVLKNRVESCHYWKKDNSQFKVIWTPRWAIDEGHGKSNFFSYKDSLVDYFKKSDNSSFILRPHPLAFRTFIENGLLTEAELNEYRGNFDNKNMFIDDRGDYISTFWVSDVLISDISSVIIEYFIMGKPIIYCESSVQSNAVLEEILKGCYIAKDFKDITNYLENLKQGNDPLKEKRKEIIKSIFDLDKLKNTSKNILEELLKDMNK